MYMKDVRILIQDSWKYWCFLIIFTVPFLQ